jgi:ABC-type glycerol-3-phosphate transport system substrate-binding protein
MTRTLRLGLALTLSILSMDAALGQDVVPLKIFMPQFPDADLETNKFTKLVEEKFGVDITFEVTSLDSGPAKEKRQISLASGDLPDAYFLIPWVDGFSRPEILRLGSEGALLPLRGSMPFRSGTTVTIARMDPSSGSIRPGSRSSGSRCPRPPRISALF